MSNHHSVHFKYLISLFVSYTLVQLRKVSMWFSFVTLIVFHMACSPGENQSLEMDWRRRAVCSVEGKKGEVATGTEVHAGWPLQGTHLHQPDPACHHWLSPVIIHRVLPFWRGGHLFLNQVSPKAHDGRNLLRDVLRTTQGFARWGRWKRIWWEHVFRWEWPLGIGRYMRGSFCLWCMSCGCNFIDQDLLQKFPAFREQWIDSIMYGTEGEKNHCRHCSWISFWYFSY